MSPQIGKYNFLLKPLFFIFSLLFASWLVLKIEKLRPSDFGKERYLFENEPVPSVAKYDEQYLKNLFLEYKFGIINSRQLDEKLEFFLKPGNKPAVMKN
ncbi:MAG: hypothetical protein Q7W13_01155 [Bacteroidia bacterium]|nr:hypothetical protein [Bacteroidia bacterium]